MAPSQYAVELCTLLVEETHGQLHSHIFSTLLHNGRLEIAGIIRHTRLTPRQVKRGLAVLIQQHLVFHHSADSDSATAYEADWKGAYSLLRSGKIVQYTHDKFGKLAAIAISRLLQLGHCRVRDIAKEVGTSLKNGNSVGVDNNLPNGLSQGRDHKHLTNGNNNKSSPKPHGIHETLQILAQHGFIRRMKQAYFRSPADNRVEAEKWVRIHKTFTKAKGPQLRLEIDQAVEITLDEWYDGKIHDGQILNGTPLGSKRPRAGPDVGRSRKRGRLQNGVRKIQDEEENESNLEPSSFSDNLIICVHHEKYLVAFRNATLIVQAEQSIGKTTSQVYEALLARVEQRLQRCKPNHDIFPNRKDADSYIPTYHISHELDASLDTKVLTSAIGQADPNKIKLNGISRSERKRRLDVDDEEEALVGFVSPDESIETEPDDDAEMPRALKYYNKEVAITDPVISHLLLLAEDPIYPFCENLELQKWLVPFQRLSFSLICKSLLSIITTRFGTTSARLARILLTSAPNIPTLKLSEAQLTAKSLLPARTVRSALARMQAAQFLAIQEIPRDNQRQPSRTTYLWFFDAERVRTIVEGECYKTMSRLIQRINMEKRKSKALLDKLDRSDVKGNEDKFLTAGESQGLGKWRAIESKIWGQVGRLDEMVMVLRDF